MISQSVPATEPVARGTKVSVVLASGPPLVAVQGVLTMPYKQAETKLNALGFEVRITWSRAGGMEPSAAIKVNPSVGTPVPEGSLIVLWSRNRPKLSAQLRVARGAAGRAAPPAQFAKPKT